MDDQTRLAFRTFWGSTFELYSAFHKLSMLNDLAIPKTTRERFRKEVEARRFASRLPEPQDEEKVFRFERVNFFGQGDGEYGTTFDAIIEECFGVRPPISEEPRQDIQKLMESNDPEEIRTGIARLGYSVEKAFLADRLRQLMQKEGA